jgi:hypothetical protein
MCTDAGTDAEAHFRQGLIQDNSKHRAAFPPPDTPPGFWVLGFPDEAACELAEEAAVAAADAAAAAAEALAAAEAAIAALPAPPEYGTKGSESSAR